MNLSANKKPTGPFEFGIMELSRFLDKSPATIRKNEADGLFTSPRNGNNDRTYQTPDIRAVVAKLLSMGRIDAQRAHIVESLMTTIELLEVMNDRTNRG